MRGIERMGQVFRNQTDASLGIKASKKLPDLDARIKMWSQFEDTHPDLPQDLIFANGGHLGAYEIRRQLFVMIRTKMPDHTPRKLGSEIIMDNPWGDIGAPDELKVLAKQAHPDEE